ncbi:NAD(P)H-binding protein [Spirosoma sordidisoli]|uniref:NAD-dependent epimerase/dehydratase family protein n=1 Tax=Spirosoma sordidisoli TaxID=2502893 RepID=A0A4Q2UEU4_9BACT|nr:NAD(P)H-binding protein [Spirosoma sordidisoli]RYC67783.1 NAD-dependent epimerase/dehydratase family protein [Spirosoma sordidisoli]
MRNVISIIGCGWLGAPLADQLLAEGYQVRGSTTSDEKVDTLRLRGIDAYKLQLGPEPVGNLEALLNADTVVINVPPKAGKLGDDFHPQQVAHLTDAIRSAKVAHVIYVSSTSVYPELSRTLDEADVTTEDQSAAPALVRAEKLVQRLQPGCKVTILRFGGLMGYDRIPGKYVAGKTVDSGAVPVNYLHRDDAVGILTVVIDQAITGVFNGVAPEHPTREAIYRKSCADFGYALPIFVTPQQPIPYKLIGTSKLQQQIPYTFRFPDPLQFPYGA